MSEVGTDIEGASPIAPPPISEQPPRMGWFERIINWGQKPKLEAEKRRLKESIRGDEQTLANLEFNITQGNRIPGADEDAVEKVKAGIARDQSKLSGINQRLGTEPAPTATPPTAQATETPQTPETMKHTPPSTKLRDISEPQSPIPPQAR